MNMISQNGKSLLIKNMNACAEKSPKMVLLLKEMFVVDKAREAFMYNCPIPKVSFLQLRVKSEFHIISLFAYAQLSHFVVG
jgi:hypothetical protein